MSGYEIAERNRGCGKLEEAGTCQRCGFPCDPKDFYCRDCVKKGQEEADKMINEVLEKLEDESQLIQQRRKEGYAFINDYELFDVVGVCKDCGWRADIEKFILTKHKKIIPVTCVKCLSTNINIVDER